uniref:Uncharacterized protein n=1 Tax=Candidatus Kentrum sp. LFY TaxID=2126342 RepID=A0A450X6U2_9GAMM|nr:MAG: hypothetical protein BECKLFY1418C_GA0070996_12132 [Candidatus Kentron sp. LFY]
MARIQAGKMGRIFYLGEGESARFLPSLALGPGIHAGMTGAAKWKDAGSNNATPVIPPGIGGTQRQGRQ